MSTDLRIADLERRIAALEQGHHNSRVRGWFAAARVLNVSAATVHRWFKTDPNFPKPVRVRVFKGKNQRRISPEWNLSQLTSYRK